MQGKFRRFISISLCLIMVGIGIAGCSSGIPKSNSTFETNYFAEMPEENDPVSDEASPFIGETTLGSTSGDIEWYSTETRVYQDSASWTFLHSDSVHCGITDDNKVVTSSFLEDSSGEATGVRVLNVYDLEDGEHLGIIALPAAEYYVHNQEVYPLTFLGDSYVSIVDYDVDGELISSKIYRVDTDNMTLGDSPVVLLTGADDSYSVYGSYSFGDITILTCYSSNEMTEYYDTNPQTIFFVHSDSNGNVLSYDCMAIDGLSDISNIVRLSDTIFAMKSAYNGICMVDSQNLSASTETYDIPQYLMGINGAFNDRDGNLYVADSRGLYCVDTDSGSYSLVIDYSMSDADRSRVDELVPIVKVGNDFVYSGIHFSNTSYCDDRYFVRFTPGEFPYSGREIIDVGIEKGIDPNLSEAISSFNHSNLSYYVRASVITCYGVEPQIELSNTELYYADPTEDRNFEPDFHAALETFLSNDNTYDVVILKGNDEVINNSEVFINLNDYIDGSNGYDRSMLFDNILRGSEVNGALYEFPLEFSFSALGLNTSEFEEIPINDNHGITFNGFASLNRLNQIDERLFNFYSTSAFIDTLIEQNSQEMLLSYRNSGNLGGSFIQLVSCVQDFDEISSDYNFDYDAESIMEPTAFYARRITNISMFLDITDGYGDSESNIPGPLGDDFALMAFPSAEGTAPAAVIGLSVGIMANSDNPDSAWLFIKSLFDIEPVDGISISRDKICSLGELFGYWGDGEEGLISLLQAYGYTVTMDDIDEMVESFSSCVENISVINTTNYRFNSSLYSEIERVLSGEISVYEARTNVQAAMQG